MRLILTKKWLPPWIAEREICFDLGELLSRFFSPPFSVEVGDEGNPSDGEMEGVLATHTGVVI